MANTGHGTTPHGSLFRDRFRDPLGWLLDTLPWPLRRFYVAARFREWPWRVPDSVRLIGWRRPTEGVMAALRRLDDAP